MKRPAAHGDLAEPASGFGGQASAEAPRVKKSRRERAYLNPDLGFSQQFWVTHVTLVLDLKWQTFLFQAFVSRSPLQ